MGVDIYKLARETHKDEVYLLALNLNADAVKAKTKAMQAAYDNPNSVTYMLPTCGRKMEDLCAEDLYKAWREIAIEAIIKQYSREEMVQLLNLLEKPEHVLYPGVSFCDGIELSADELMNRWNKLFAKKDPNSDSRDESASEPQEPIYKNMDYIV